MSVGGPSEKIIAASSQPSEVRDALGRRLMLRRLNALDRLRLFKAAGPVLSENAAYLGMAMLAVSVSAMDDVPIPAPNSEAQIEALIARLGDEGLDAAASAYPAEPLAPEHQALYPGN